MKRNYVIAMIVAVLLLGAGTVMIAHAQMGGMGVGHGWHRGGGFLAHMSRRLDLTQAQQEQVKQMWEAEKPSVMPLVQQLAQGHKQMVEASAGGNFDQAKVTAIANQQAQALAQLMVAKERLTAKFYTILTPEQRTKFDSMRQQQLAHIDKFVGRMTTAPWANESK